MNQVLFTQILKTSGYRFKIVENGKLAVASWKVHKPKLILMDVSMPEMNGHQATQEIRRIEVDGDIDEPVTIIGVTAHALNGDNETCFDAGMDGYLPKPLSIGRLQEVIETHLEPGSGSSLEAQAG